MHKRIVITSGKGGAGKSTVAIGIAAAMALAKKQVLLIDACAGLRGLDLMLGVSEQVAFDLGDVLRGRCDIASAVLKTSLRGLRFLPAPAHAGDFQDGKLFAGLLTPLESIFDYILIDAPNPPADSFATAAHGSRFFLLVTTYDESSVRACAKAALYIAKDFDAAARLILNRQTSAPKPKGDLLSRIDSIVDKTGVQLLGALPEDASLQSGGLPSYQDGRLPAAAAFARIAGRLRGERIPFTAV